MKLTNQTISDFAALKTRQRALRENWPQPFALRIHRAVSWVGRAERETEDRAATFLFLWIAFNAAYGGERTEPGERDAFGRFIERLTVLDAPGKLYSLVWTTFPGPRARGVVGVIAAPGCQLEILPKIEAAGERSAASKAILRRRLVHMLAVVHDLTIDAGAMAELGWQKDTLLEILIRLFCGRLADAVRRGMPRRYVSKEDDLPTLRGRLDIMRQFSVLAAQPQRLACRFDELSSDIALNQVMKAAVLKLSRLAQAPDNQRQLRELGFVYCDITPVPPSALPWDRIVLDRTNGRWKELLALARLLLGDRFQQTSAGDAGGHALLFEMNVLFEAYVARLTRRALAGTALRVTTQGGHANCLYEGERGRFRTRPDIIVLAHSGIWDTMAEKQSVSQPSSFREHEDSARYTTGPRTSSIAVCRGRAMACRERAWGLVPFVDVHWPSVWRDHPCLA